HKGLVNHTLEQCEMLKKYYNRVAHHDEDKKKDAGDKGGDDEFPPVENAFFIFGGATTNMTSRQRKRERREVFSVTRATPSYLDWSKDTISFGREDHPDYVPHLGRYPLVVDPIIGNTRFSKVLMDGGSSLNIMYAHTLELMGIGLDKLCPSKIASGRTTVPPNIFAHDIAKPSIDLKDPAEPGPSNAEPPGGNPLT